MNAIEALEIQLSALEADSGEAESRIEIHRRLAELYEGQADFAQALHHYKQYHNLTKQVATPFFHLSPPQMDRRRLAEALRRSRVKTRELYQVSRSLNTARNEHDL